MIQENKITYMDSLQEEFKERLNEHTREGFEKCMFLVEDMQKSNVIGNLVGLVVLNTESEKEEVHIHLIRKARIFFRDAQTKELLPFFLKQCKKDLEERGNHKVIASFMATEATMTRYKKEAADILKEKNIESITKADLELLEELLDYKIDTYTLVFETPDAHFAEVKHIIWEDNTEQGAYVLSPDPVMSNFKINGDETGSKDQINSKFSIF